MKTRYLLSLLVAVVAAVFTSCSDQYEPSHLDTIQVSSSYVAIDSKGGETNIIVTATDSWALDESKIPAWLTITPTSGAAGETKVKFSAEAGEGRTAELRIACGGNTQIINVIQGIATVENASVKEILAGPDGKTYRTTGVVTKIAESATYGNFYINDGSSDTDLYIYGTKYNGATKQGALLKLNIEVGDEVVIEGPKTTYGTTVELVDIDVIKVNKSLIKIDALTVGGDTTNTLPLEGGDITAHITCKGDGVYAEIPEDAKEWLSIASVTGGSNPTVKFHAAKNEGGMRSTDIVIKTMQNGKEYSSTATIAQEGAIASVNCAEFNSKADGTALYKVHGIITKIANTTYGNIYINDGTGEVYVYGVLDADGKEKNFSSLGLKVGDEVTLQSAKTSHNNAPQMKNATVVESVAHDVKTAAELQELADDKNTYYLVTGTVFHMEGENIKFDLTTYGNFGLRDESGEIYVYGVADALDGVTKNFAATGIQEGDKITILAYKTSYKGLNQIVGKFIKKETAAE